MAISLTVLLVVTAGSALGLVATVPLASESLPTKTGEGWNGMTVNEVDTGVQDDERNTYIREAEGHRMAKVTWIGDSAGDQLVDCELFGDNLIIGRVLEGIPEDQIRFVEGDKMKEVINHCIKLLTNKHPTHSKSPEAHLAPVGWRSGILSDLAIYPGTKWCGPGDIAEDFNDLGEAVEADKCCRAHDHCNVTLRAYEYNDEYGLKNKAWFTKSHCDCDYDFYECLSKAGTIPARNVGRWLFNYIQVQCFKKDYPILSCLKWKGIFFIHQSCQEYLQDETKPKKWQFFDPRYFETSDGH